MENTKKIAVLFKMVCEGYKGADALGKKAAQKIFYFFERAGLNLNLRYGIHYYGPYSAKLDDIMYELESEGYLTIDISQRTHVIHYGSENMSEDVLNAEERKIAEHILNIFGGKQPMELEALSTMDYIMHSLLPATATDQDIISKFKQIKATKFEQNVIDHTLLELKELKLTA
ncbi:MAG: hypothetical protein NC094_07545 [Bacteroidales bacterium]|nr:hypothetical protein [Lachnoclostridium sp.]MCM1384733.1 hypothetical protein [Lachnoclostridium sp.]MCM1465253.1 hypothetical protein [Bacteroidales bacterium]